jgi:hypothetical protein
MVSPQIWRIEGNIQKSLQELLSAILGAESSIISGGVGHRCELSFMVEDEQIVRGLRKKWGEFGVVIEQDLHEAVFGLTFVALDPDGHRIRVCIPDK